jgi:hypothetical protein
MSPLDAIAAHWFSCAVVLVVVLLLLLAGVLYLRLGFAEEDRYHAEAERDQLRVMVQTMQSMSRTHADTIARMAAVAGKKHKKGGR